MMDPGDQLYLKICNTLDHVSEFFRELRCDSSHTNVVLQPFLMKNENVHEITEVNVLQAHKEVLAAASPLLAEVMENACDACDDVCISFTDYTHNQLKLLLDYIYTGEIQASKLVMEEFEVILKELGILGTHSYTVVEESWTKDEDCISLELEAHISKEGLSESCFKESKDDDDSQDITTLEFVEEDGSFVELANENSDETVPSQSTNKLKNKFTCEICREILPSKEELRSHIQIHSSKRPYVCPICQKSFRHLNVLKTHSRVHTGEKPFTCTTCNRSFAHKSTLNEHMNLHSGDRPYKCDVCQRRFKQRKSLRAHRCEDAQEEVFQCEVCGRQFINRKALALHRIHHEAENGKTKEPQEKPFLCDVCARGFSNKYLLKAHQATHSEEKRFECSVCHKRFAHKKTLQVHEASHKPGGEKGPYRCNYCPKSFRYVANLDAHERIHTGHKPFECQLCSATFRQKSSLKEHMVTHGSTDKSFHCEICGKSFQARRQFVAHRYSHVKQTQRCPVCKKRFYNSERLATHISMHDNIDDLPEPEIGAVTAHVNEDGELIITQDVSQSNQALILTPSSLLHVIQGPVGDAASAVADAGAHDHDQTEDVDQSAQPEDARPQWAFEVVIEPRP